jgi:hypothetical protein
MISLRSVPSGSITTALTGIAGFGPFFALTIGPAERRWRPVTDAYADGSAYLVAARGDRYGTSELRIAASIVQLGHAARLWSVVLGCGLAYGVIPDLGGLHQEAEGPLLRLPAPRGWHAPAGDALAPALYRIVMEEHLASPAAGLRVKVAGGLLHGNAASALAEAGRYIVRARPDLHLLPVLPRARRREVR